MNKSADKLLQEAQQLIREARDQFAVELIQIAKPGVQAPMQLTFAPDPKLEANNSGINELINMMDKEHKGRTRAQQSADTMLSKVRVWEMREIARFSKEGLRRLFMSDAYKNIGERIIKILEQELDYTIPEAILTHGSDLSGYYITHPLFGVCICELNIRTQTMNALFSRDVISLRELLVKDTNTLMRIRNFGQTCINEVDRELARIGLVRP